MIVVIAIVIAPGASRVVREAVLAVKQNTFVDAACAAGAAPWRIVLGHILPNVFAPILVIATVWLGNAIVIEAALSFLGLGTPPPIPTWGGMLGGEGRRISRTRPTWPSSRGSPSASWCWPSTCWATPSATCSTPACARANPETGAAAARSVRRKRGVLSTTAFSHLCSWGVKTCRHARVRTFFGA